MKTECKANPKACAQQVGIQVVFIVCSIILLSLISDKPMPGYKNMATFSFLAFGLMFSANMLSTGMSDKILYPVMSAVAARLFSIMVPQYISW